MFNMLHAVRRGPTLARALRVCAPRSLQSTQVSAARIAKFKTVLPSVYSPTSHVRFFQSTIPQKQAGAATATAQREEPKPLSEFSELAAQDLVHPRIVQTITNKMGLTTMTDVQGLTIPHTVRGIDTLAKAKTGTGKTLAFLIPVLQKLITNDPQLLQGRVRASSRDIRAIIISPTRELAEQIAVEAKKVAFNTGIVIQTAVGGTRKQERLEMIKRQGCHILVATPGRLKDILENDRSSVSAPNLDFLVLDEADRLLDDGFGPEIDAIKDLLPDPSIKDRQTLMFSATVPREVMGMVRKAMKPGFQYINTVAENEVPTHLRVPQKVVFCRGYENGIPAILEILTKYRKRALEDRNMRPLKAIVYFNTTAEVQLAHEVFEQLFRNATDRHNGSSMGRRIFSMHSKLSQGQRTRFSDAFRHSQSAILISSDVTARGLDFPDVTHVIQMSIPRSRESYIHRLGRTGRANKEGEGWIIIHDMEDRAFVERLGDLPIEQDQTIEAANVDMSKPEGISEPDSKQLVEQIAAAYKKVPYEAKRDAYRVQINTNISNFSRKQEFADAINNLALHGYILPEPPALSSSTLQKFGLHRVRGMNVDETIRPDYESRGKKPRFDPRSSRFSRPRRDGQARGRFSSDNAPWQNRSHRDRY